MLMRHYSPNRRGVGGRHSEPANPTVARGSTQGWHHAAGTVHIFFIVCTVVQYSKLILHSMSPPVIKVVWFGFGCTSKYTVSSGVGACFHFPVCILPATVAASMIGGGGGPGCFFK
jgi:hypothetical protein